jgi:hypothetical protein
LPEFWVDGTWNVPTTLAFVGSVYLLDFLVEENPAIGMLAELRLASFFLFLVSLQ